MVKTIEITPPTTEELVRALDNANKIIERHQLLAYTLPQAMMLIAILVALLTIDVAVWIDLNNKINIRKDASVENIANIKDLYNKVQILDSTITEMYNNQKIKN